MFDKFIRKFLGRNNNSVVTQEYDLPSNQTSEYNLTDSDYLTLRPGEQMPLLGGVPTDTYLKMRLYKNYFIWGPMLEKLVRYHPNIQELHCMLSATRPMFVEVEYEYSYENERKYAPLHYNVSGLSKRPGPNSWLRAQMVDGSLTPWYCVAFKAQNITAETKKIQQQAADMFAQAAFSGDVRFVYLLDIQTMVTELVTSSPACALADDKLVNMFNYLDGDPSLIESKIAEGRRLIQQRQKELLKKRAH
jgi:hypothetical protein